MANSIDVMDSPSVSPSSGPMRHNGRGPSILMLPMPLHQRQRENDDGTTEIQIDDSDAVSHPSAPIRRHRDGSDAVATAASSRGAMLSCCRCHTCYVSRGIVGITVTAVLLAVGLAGIATPVGTKQETAMVYSTATPDCTRSTQLTVWDFTVVTCLNYHFASATTSGPQCYTVQELDASVIAQGCNVSVTAVVAFRALAIVSIVSAAFVGLTSWVETRLPAQGPRRVRMVDADGDPVPGLNVILDAEEREADELVAADCDCDTICCTRSLDAPCSSMQHMLAHPWTTSLLALVCALCAAGVAWISFAVWNPSQCAVARIATQSVQSSQSFILKCEDAFRAVANSTAATGGNPTPYAQVVANFGPSPYCFIAISAVAALSIIAVIAAPASTRRGERLDAPRSGAVVGQPIGGESGSDEDETGLMRRDLNPPAQKRRRGEGRRCMLCHTTIRSRYPLLRCTAQVVKDTNATPAVTPSGSPQTGPLAPPCCVPYHVVCGRCVDAHVYNTLNPATVGQEIPCPYVGCHGTWIFNIYSSFLKTSTLHRALIMYRTRCGTGEMSRSLMLSPNGGPRKSSADWDVADSLIPVFPRRFYKRSPGGHPTTDASEASFNNSMTPQAQDLLPGSIMDD